MGEGVIPFPMTKESSIKRAGIEVLLPNPLDFPCHVETICLAKNKSKSRRWWKFQKYIGNIKRNIRRENCRVSEALTY